MRDIAYIEQANGRWEAWTYSDGQRVSLGHGEYDTLRRRLDRQRFDVVLLNTKG